MELNIFLLSSSFVCFTFFFSLHRAITLLTFSLTSSLHSNSLIKSLKIQNVQTISIKIKVNEKSIFFENSLKIYPFKIVIFIRLSIDHHFKLFFDFIKVTESKWQVLWNRGTKNLIEWLSYKWMGDGMPRNEAFGIP